MAGLFDQVLPALFSAGDHAKKRIRGLLADPVAEGNNMARAAADTIRQSMGAFSGIDAETARGMGVLGSDPALQQAARDRQIAAASNFVTPLQTVWHGTPHKWLPEPGFPNGRMRLDKIGTGEGAQAYGHGGYLADAKEVGQGYAKTLAEQRPTLGGKPFDEALAGSGLSEEARKFIEYSIRNAGTLDSGIAHVWNWHNRGDKAATEAYQFLRTNYPKASDASLYKLDLPDSVLPRLLDWDKPLSQQAPEVRKALEKAGISTKTLRDSGAGSVPFMDSATGMEAYSRGRAALGEDGFSRALQAHGIPGLRYLDGGSRGAGQGTSNYVIWDQGLLDQMPPLEINGIPTGLLGK